MKKLVILALVVVTFSLFGIVNNARLLGQVDEVATRISFMNAFSAGEMHVDPTQWKEGTTRNAIFDIVLYAAGFVCGIGILWGQRWARTGTVAFGTTLVAMSFIGLAEVRAGLFIGQLLLSLAVTSIGWWILYRSSSAALFTAGGDAQRPVRERPKVKVETTEAR